MRTELGKLVERLDYAGFKDGIPVLTNKELGDISIRLNEFADFCIDTNNYAMSDFLRRKAMAAESYLLNRKINNKVI